jgi:hypothetical protein
LSAEEKESPPLDDVVVWQRGGCFLIHSRKTPIAYGAIPPNERLAHLLVDPYRRTNGSTKMP